MLPPMQQQQIAAIATATTATQLSYRVFTMGKQNSQIGKPAMEAYWPESTPCGAYGSLVPVTNTTFRSLVLTPKHALPHLATLHQVRMRCAV